MHAALPALLARPHPPRRRLAAAAAAAAAALLLALATPARAWDGFGHRVVGGIADQLIAGTPTAKRVRSILGSNLQMASVWADCARSVESSGKAPNVKWAYVGAGQYKDCAVYENPASQAALVAFVQRNASRCGGFASHLQCRHKAWHFTNIPLQQGAYAPDAPGAGPDDLVQAVGACIAVLQGRKPPPGFAIANRKEALRLLVHFVGDLHQPLHVGAVYLDLAGRRLNPATDAEANASSNAGGNALRLGPAKLHAVWDDVAGKLATRLLDGEGKAAATQVPASPGAPADWAPRWATDTLGAAVQAYAPLRFDPRAAEQWPVRVDDEAAYRRARENLQQQQLVKAGARLAQLLTAVLP